MGIVKYGEIFKQPKNQNIGLCGRTVNQKDGAKD